MTERLKCEHQDGFGGPICGKPAEYIHIAVHRPIVCGQHACDKGCVPLA